MSQDDIELSPSEARAHNFAAQAAGRRSTKKTLANIVLGFELFVVFLVGLTMFGLQTFTPPYIGLAIAGVVGVGIVIAIALMRLGRVGIVLGWILHVLYFAAGLVLTPAYFVAAVFGALWVYCVLKGGQIDRDRTATIPLNEQ